MKFGYDPVTLIPKPLFSTTVWSGAVFTIDILGTVLGLLTEAESPVPALIDTFVTVPTFQLLLADKS